LHGSRKLAEAAFCGRSLVSATFLVKMLLPSPLWRMRNACSMPFRGQLQELVHGPPAVSVRLAETVRTTTSQDGVNFAAAADAWTIGQEPARASTYPAFNNLDDDANDDTWHRWRNPVAGQTTSLRLPSLPLYTLAAGT